MDDFAALKNLKGLSLRNPCKALDTKNATSLSTSSYVSSSTTHAVAASKRDDNLGRDAKRLSEEPEEPFDYYNNAYQKYMAEHGGAGEEGPAAGGGGGYGYGDEEEFVRFGEGEDDTPRDEFGEGKHVSPYSPITSPQGLNNGSSMSGVAGQHKGAVRALDFSKWSLQRGWDLHLTQWEPWVGGALPGKVDPQNYDPFAAAFKHHAESEAAVEEVLLPIHSVGAVHRAYKQRGKTEELAAQKRHAAKVVKITNKVNNLPSSGLSGQAVSQGLGGGGRGSRGRAGKVRPVEGLEYGTSTVSSLGNDESAMILGGSLDQDEDGDMPQEEPVVVIDKLDYSQYSCDELVKNELLARVRKCLTSGTQVLLRTVQGGDALDGKMLLKTLSNHHASYTDNAYIVPPISRSADGESMEMALKPKKVF